MSSEIQIDCRAIDLGAISAKLSMALFLVFSLPRMAKSEYNREDYEEPAGASVKLLLNPADGIYGMTTGEGTWLKGTPVFGDYEVSIFSNDIEESWYSGIGMTIRIMPHWRFAPFIGGGGSYNYSFSRREENLIFDQETPYANIGDSYWGGHSEAGFRFWTEDRSKHFEIAGRYIWTSLDREYWLVTISTGIGI